jgi:hypothetical protein
VRASIIKKYFRFIKQACGSFSSAVPAFFIHMTFLPVHGFTALQFRRDRPEQGGRLQSEIPAF